MSIDTGCGVADPDLAPGGPPRPGKKWKLTLVGLIGSYVVLGGYSLVTNVGEIGGSAPSQAATATAAPSAPGKGAPSAPARAVAASPSFVKHAKPRPTEPTRGAVSSAAHPLGMASITAFGPEGTSDGDNPDTAYRILDVATEQPWYSQWYATPAFGGLRSGTGLLLDLGKPATVTDMLLTLGREPGADIQVRVGSTPSMDLPTMASAWGAGGTVRLTAATPAEGRYVLIWFTRLPPDGHGHYQVNVYNVSVDGINR